MGIINILDTRSANMIAAGEVVDRPASAIKELCENAVDAGARHIEITVRAGGNSYICVSDDGCGFFRDDLPKALCRHATSKISDGSQIDGVKTLGFRGEALAAISSVARMEIISKRQEDTFGNRLTCDENGVELYEVGCPDGTSIIIKDLFYNVPARRKFMKKDSSESAACLAVCEKLALSHPEISVSFTSDDTVRFKTTGNAKLLDVIYSLYGSEFAKNVKPVDYTLDGVTVTGFASKPENPRGSRNMQSFFINGRYVKSKTVQAALEEAYRSYIASGKYPAGILNIMLDYGMVDVNVHPAKTEIKFANEKAVFSAVYYAIRNLLETGKQPVVEPVNKVMPVETGVSVSENRPQTPFRAQNDTSEPRKKADSGNSIEYKAFIPNQADGELGSLARDSSEFFILHDSSTEKTDTVQCTIDAADTAADKPFLESAKARAPHIIGEAYNTLVFAELQEKVLIIDKHAAHERLIYEELKRGNIAHSQELLIPVSVTLSVLECDTLLENSDYLISFGFAVERFGPDTVAVRAVPARLGRIKDIDSILEAFARDITASGNLPFNEKCDKALYTMACKAAVRAGDRTDENENLFLVEEILKHGLKYCPHGRPFIKEISKKELFGFFDR